MVQASKKSEVILHKNPLENSQAELNKEISDKEVPVKELQGKKKSVKKIPEQELPDKKESEKDLDHESHAKEVTVKETPNKNSSKKELLKKRKPSLHITFHNPNSEEITASFLTKVLAERVAEEMGKGTCK
ncbi:hypothetical protein GCM10023142_10690 [Anaerocolumna aminovalerica]|uniref:Uncharacterized protein n=1 Tax=Anaerocolumna aminovalerica TaxID=1527 RepID=A0A1I5HCA8_9FIRM|nr:hypothetical protein [Anaerocolumna aminovalerica]SFO45895.1 hypothetical protein SAMN04489757_12823 [Anaerocolumna aminovalerica]